MGAPHPMAYLRVNYDKKLKIIPAYMQSLLYIMFVVMDIGCSLLSIIWTGIENKRSMANEVEGGVTKRTSEKNRGFLFHIFFRIYF